MVQHGEELRFGFCKLPGGKTHEVAPLLRKVMGLLAFSIFNRLEGRDEILLLDISLALDI